MENKINSKSHTPNWFARHPRITVLGVAVLIVYILININGKGQSPTTSQNTVSTDSDKLSVTVKEGYDGVYVTDDESIPWTDCMVGLNGTDGWGFDNPPFQTRNLVSFSPHQQTIIPFSNITTSDGTSFDSVTHSVNTVVIECFKGTKNSRMWIGASKTTTIPVNQ